MERVTLRWRAATVVLQGLLALIFLISGISALKCHSSSTVKLTTPHKGNTTSTTSIAGGIRNCSSAENVCTDAQLTFTIDKDVLIMSHKGCASKDLMDGTKPFTSGDRHFAIQFDQSYCFGDLCNAKTREVSKTPIKDEVTGSNQCYSGFGWGGSIKGTMKCSKDYDRCYQGSMNITIAIDAGGFSSVPMIIRTCQRSSCDVIKSQSFGPINITSESGPCCSGSKCNWKDDGFSFNMNSTANRNLFSDKDEDEDNNLGHAEVPVTLKSGFQGLSLQLCPFLAVLGATVLGI
ncbi:ly6/PLAUR domain-containing protein 3-like [Lacerta agilis]|uniref:ly6/PLAUR domain-containing protein 3-like n=1 Tax=Lacerta agilis TaxID=80427 RepID=UPI0014196908|nr:ly6/PLAUR domain-containing protein 3-like [Lacerta agilis]XP_033014136.1 ly6/PLAUR domain-containing protein 3-like [Lacerta agilis]